MRTRRWLRPGAVGLVLLTAAVVAPVVHQSGSSLALSLGVALVDRDDGVVAGGVTAFDESHPAVVNLDPLLLRALRAAATDAAADGVELTITSGWRSAAYQDQLLRESVAQHGSVDEAARWVATADTSAHVTGDAVDIGPVDAWAWLSAHGAEHGLCQVYGNEPWHIELRPDAVAHGCPPMYPDPTHDPRMHVRRHADQGRPAVGARL